MANLFFSVWTDASRTALDAPLQEGVVDFSGGATQSAAISGDNNEIRWVRILADADCFVAWGTNPTAANDGTSGMAVGAENPEYIGVKAGHKFSAISRA